MMISSVTFLTWRALPLIIFLTIGVEQSLYVKLFTGGKNSPQFKSVCITDIPDDEIMAKLEVLCIKHCVKSVRIRRFSGPYFPAFGLNMGIYSEISVFSPNSGKYGPENSETGISHAVKLLSPESLLFVLPVVNKKKG